MLDPGSRVISWNAGAQHIKGYEADEIIGKNFMQFYTEEDQLAGEPKRSGRWFRCADSGITPKAGSNGSDDYP